MGLFSTIRKIFSSQQLVEAPSPPPPEPDEDEIEVPELSVELLHERMAGPTAPTLLDVREQHEWNQVRMPEARHIPMNEIPARLSELTEDQELIVICAHGQRSYGVAHYLLENGFNAVSLDGGITGWAAAGYPVDVGPVLADD